MSATVIRTLLLALALLNQILSACGRPVLPIADETVSELVSALFTVVTALVTWWKNNSVTAEARAGDALMKQLKEERHDS